eukprot:g6697.t1
MVEAAENTKDSKQFSKALALVGDSKRFEEARKQILTRPGQDTEDIRIKRCVQVMNTMKVPVFPITRKKALDFFTALVGDEQKSFYASADNYLSSVVARLKCIDGAFDMSAEDEAAIRAVVRRQRRAGKFEHEQAPGILLEEIMEVYTFNPTFAAVVAIGFLFGLRRRTLLQHVKFGGRCDMAEKVELPVDPNGYNSEEEEESNTDVPGAAFADIDQDKNEFQHYSGDFKYNPKSRVFMLDLTGYVLKSNVIKQIYANCLCKKEGLEVLCPHICVPVAAEDSSWKGEFIDNISEFFGHTRTHCMREAVEALPPQEAVVELAEGTSLEEAVEEAPQEAVVEAEIPKEEVEAETETSAHANACNDCPAKLYTSAHELRAVNNTIRLRTFHTDAKNVMIIEQVHGQPAGQQKNKVPISFIRTLKALTVDGRARRTLTDVQFGLVRDEYETLCERIPEGVTKENWEKQVEEFAWQSVFEKGKNKVGDRMAGGIQTTYQDRLAAMFNGEFLPRMRLKVDTFTSASACLCLGMMLPGMGNQQGAYGPDRRGSISGSDAGSPYNGGFGGGMPMGGGVVQQQVPVMAAGAGGGQLQAPKQQLPKVCWHNLKRTPCNENTWNQNGFVYCKHGLHPMKGQLDANTYEAIKKSRYGKKQLKSVQFESWLLCTPVPQAAAMPQPMQFGFGMNMPQQFQQAQPQMQMPMQMPTVAQPVQQPQNPMQASPMLQQMLNMMMQQQQMPRWKAFLHAGGSKVRVQL